MAKKSSIAKNSIYNIGYRVFGVLFPLVSQAYIARVLLPEQIGMVAFAQNVVSYFTFLAPLGIAKYGVKEISSKRDDSKSLNAVFTELFIINFISTIIFSLLYYIMVLSFGYFSDERTLYLIVGMNIFFNMFNVDWFYMGVERFDFIAKRSISIKLLSFFALISFVKKPSDYILYACISVIALCGNYFISFAGLRRNVSFSTKGLNILVHLKPLIILLASSIASELYIMLDSTMIRIIKGNEELAYYTTSTKITRIAFAVLSAMFATFFPRLSLLWKNNKEEYKNFLCLETDIAIFLGIPCSIGILMCAREILLTVFGSRYTNSIQSLQILSPLMIIFSVAYVLGHIPLLIYGEEKRILSGTVVAAIVNVCLNSALIPLFGRNGAAIASVIAELTVTVILIYHSWKRCPLNINLNTTSKTLICSAVMATVLFASSLIHLSPYIQLLIKLVLGIVVYFAIATIIKHPILNVIKRSSAAMKITGLFKKIR